MERSPPQDQVFNEKKGAKETRENKEKNSQEFLTLKLQKWDFLAIAMCAKNMKK